MATGEPGQEDLDDITDPRPYQAHRSGSPAEGPAQSDADETRSLPPGSSSPPDDGERGDVDRAMPYEGDPSPLRMHPQPFPRDLDGEDPSEATTP